MPNPLPPAAVPSVPPSAAPAAIGHRAARRSIARRAIGLSAIALAGCATPPSDGAGVVPRLIAQLQLQPIPQEGGYFVQTWHSDATLPAAALPARYGQPRAAGTAIYALLTPQAFSALHLLLTDEVWHFYAGTPLELLLLHPDGRGERLVLGPDVLAGQRPQVVVPQGTWQGARPLGGGAYSLVGTTMAPGFDPADYTHGDLATLLQRYPSQAAAIRQFTRE